MLKKVGQFLLQCFGVLAYPFMFIGAILALICSPIMYVFENVFHSKR